MPGWTVHEPTIEGLVRYLRGCENIETLRKIRFNYEIGPFAHRAWKEFLNKWRANDLHIADHVTQKFWTRKGLVVASGDGYQLYRFALDVQRITRGGVDV